MFIASFGGTHVLFWALIRNIFPTETGRFGKWRSIVVVKSCHDIHAKQKSTAKHSRDAAASFANATYIVTDYFKL